ncbi:MAG: hypothetical protein ACR2FZ_05255 [Thermoleophilaceae bacterium]|nr:hypothetical protein [Thermoleophilaceae bacterium]
MSSPERFWTSRLRWRLHGAWQWPAFALFTLVDGVVLDLLPPLGAARMDLILGVLIATFANLFLVGAVAPFLTRRLSRRREAALAASGAGRTGPAPPHEVEREVLQDRVGTALLAAGLVAVLVSGLANRPVTVSETEATEEVGRELRSYVVRSGSEELNRNLETANTIRLSEGYFRACIARDDRRRYVCLFVDTTSDPTAVREDRDARPNSAFAR